MSLTPLFKQCFCLALVLALAAIPLAALAGDVDPSGDKLMELVDDPKYKAALEEKGGANAANPLLAKCWAEVATVVGGVIWGARAQEDHCSNYHHQNAFYYCALYSTYCDHYHWQSKCLFDQGCPQR